MVRDNIYQQRGDKLKAERNWKNAQRALETCEATDFVSDLTDMTVEQLSNLLEKSLATLNNKN